jgi:LPPG:FO 2-phospho-L-lactate transferase
MSEADQELGFRSMKRNEPIVALAGGVGAARFLRGLVQVIDPVDLTVIVNTGDDDRFHGLPVSPDLDTVTYTLAGAENVEQGWGLAGETFAAMDALDRYGIDTWFRLGDRDLATHIYRAERFRAGAPLSTVTAEIAAAWGLRFRMLPMSDDRVATRIELADPGSGPAVVAMQEWFVHQRANSLVKAVTFAGAATASPAPGVLEAIRDADRIVICPSNPIISIGPIRALPAIEAALQARRDDVVAVSPIIAGATVKGPADRLLRALDYDVSCVGVARAYAPVCGTLVIDEQDAARAAEIEALGMRVVITDTLMRDARIAAALAQRALDAVA